MASPQARHSSRRNLSPGSKDEPAGKALTKGSDIYTFIPATSYAPIPAPAFTPLSNNGLFQ